MMCNSSTNWGTCLSQPCYTAREYANVALQWIESTPSWLWIGSPDQYPGFHIEIASNFWQLSPPKIWENYWVESLGPIPSFGWFKKVFPPHGSQLLSSLYIYRNVKLQYCTVFISILLYIFHKMIMFLQLPKWISFRFSLGFSCDFMDVSCSLAMLGTFCKRNNLNVTVNTSRKHT